MLKQNAQIHFIGIGGIGMSALAQVLLARGYIVTGSDIKPNNLTELLERKGGRVFKGHKVDNVGSAQIVVYSSSISKDNPELVEAKRKNLLVMHRAQLLSELMKERIGIAVTGSHGKTTTASMISDILIKAGCDPVCILGGEALSLNGNAYAGKGKFLVAEADESDGTHLYLEPRFGIITNIDREHLDYYKDAEHIIQTNLKFLERIQPDGTFLGLIDNELIRKLLVHYDRRFATFGLSRDANLYASNIRIKGLRTQFDCIYNKRNIGTVRLRIPGMYNILNALASILLALHIGIDFETIAQALFEYKSAKRRFEIYPDMDGITLVEDYAHHPTEISATLEACRALAPKRILTVFQPHRYTRTKELQKEFGSCFSQSDRLILTNIYAASEDPIEGISVKNIYDEVLKNGLQDVHIMPKKNICDYLYDNLEEGDLVAVLGAGDIGSVAKRLHRRFKEDGKRS